MGYWSVLDPLTPGGGAGLATGSGKWVHGQTGLPGPDDVKAKGQEYWDKLKDGAGGLGLPGFGGLGPDKATTVEPQGWQGNLQQSRGQMQSAMDPVQAWALTGQGPSAAQAQLQSGKDQSIAAAQSQAKSAYGLTPGQQASLSTNAGTQAAQQAANQAAQLRAMEQQQAMQNYLGMLAAQRQADIDVYKAYSDQYAQTNMANAQSGNAFKGGLIGTAGGIIGGILG